MGAIFLCVDCRTFMDMDIEGKHICPSSQHPSGTYLYDVDGTLEGALAQYRHTFKDRPIYWKQSGKRTLAPGSRKRGNVTDGD